MMADLLAGVRDPALFIGAGLLLNLTPGADMALVAARAGAHGLRHGAAAALGVGAGCVLHALAAALGLSALLAGSAAAFELLRWLGAAYLVWLGIGLLRGGPVAAGAALAAAAPPSLARVFGQGFLTNALNPKVALFFLAFVPQFIAADAPHKTLAFLALGMVFNLNGTLVNLGVAWAVVGAKRRLGARAGRLGRAMARVAGGLFVALGLRLALAPK